MLCPPTFVVSMSSQGRRVGRDDSRRIRMVGCELIEVSIVEGKDRDVGAAIRLPGHRRSAPTPDD